MGYEMNNGTQVPTFRSNISWETLKMGAGHLDRTLVPTYQSLSGYDSQDHVVNSGSNTAELHPHFF
jgi:hypothetical protein